MKIAVLGAGSGTFALNLIRDFCLTPNLHDCEICFMDIDQKRLDASYGMCSRLSRELNVNLNITKTTDREAALRNAGYVINTILIGGYQRMREGWEIAQKHGYARGGSLHILHDEAFWINFYQLRMMEDILLDIKRLCPDAWYLMVANPVMAGTTYFRRKYPEVKFVGLCHGTGGVRHICSKLGLDMARVKCQIPGINHFVWLNEFTYDGEDAFPILDKWIAEESDAHFAVCTPSSCMAPKPVDLYKRYGVYPIGDTGNPGGGSWGYEYHSSPDVERSWKEDPAGWYENYFKTSATHVAEIDAAAHDESKRVSEIVGVEKSHEPMIPLIEALECGVEREIVVNVLNDGNYVPGIPENFQVEVPALCGKQSIKPLKTKPLPPALIARALHDRVAPVELELTAYDAHDKQLLIDLVMMDPRSHSRKQAEAFVEEILNLPYHEEMKQWYR